MSLMNLSDCKEADYNYSYPKSKIKAKSVERQCIPTDHHLDVPSQQTTKRAKEVDEEPVFFIGGNKKKKLSIDKEAFNKALSKTNSFFNKEVVNPRDRFSRFDKAVNSTLSSLV